MFFFNGIRSEKSIIFHNGDVNETIMVEHFDTCYYRDTYYRKGRCAVNALKIGSLLT